MRRAASRLLAALSVALLTGGCGYSIGLGGNLPPHIRSVAVPIFRNNTQEPAVENTITAAVVNAFVTSGRLKVVPVDQADSILDGAITGYRLELIAFTPQINVTEYRLVVTVNVRFRDVRQNVLLFSQDGLEERADFRVQGQVSETIAREDVAARQAAVDVGRRIVSSALERF
jgi:outer membrane lipopolysaccharide assembly protein LptE/RlpB